MPGRINQHKTGDTMEKIRAFTIPLLMALLLLAWAVPSWAAVSFQCPGTVVGDFDGDGMLRADVSRGSGANTEWEIEIEDLSTNNPNDLLNPQPVVCMHLTGGDGFAVMADRVTQYLFSFANVTGVDDADVMVEGALAAETPSPTIELREGDEFYLTLSNVGMHIRPDLFDPHTVHYHGLPESSNIYDGLPESGISIKMGASLTYYYKNNEPGTYMYHCHVEATEHMQMGMLGNLYVLPAQDGTLINGFDKFVYNDGDGSTGYDVAFPIQLGGFDREFHDASWSVQPLPFAEMWDDYPMINGRGYPDTINPGALPAPAENGGKVVQTISSLISANAGQRVLLRISNLNVTRFHTLASTIPMRVVGKDAKQLRAAAGENIFYTTNSITLGGGESYDVILDTSGYSGTHFLYATNLNLLSNDQEQYGGMMTEIHISGN
jgi:FtsP/CotA-like multicopper oxidase with cupredoxin domain